MVSIIKFEETKKKLSEMNNCWSKLFHVSLFQGERTPFIYRRSKRELVSNDKVSCLLRLHQLKMISTFKL